MSNASDTFTRTENPLASGWSTLTGFTALKADGANALGGTVNSENWSIWTNTPFGPDQFSEVVMNTVPSVSGVGGGPSARGSTSQGNGYLLYIDIADIRVYKTVNGSFTLLGAIVSLTPTSGHRYRLTGTGSATVTLDGYDNDTLVISRSDASSPHTSGQPGIHTYSNSGNPSWSSWKSDQSAPFLQAEGATVANTTGSLSPTIPTHQADDIIVVAAVFWGPNTAGDAAQIPTPTNYTLLGVQVGQPAAANRDGWSALFWRRVTGAGTTVTLTRGASWDTGNDTCFGARAYVIRGCRTTGDPFEDSQNTGPHTTANQAFAALTVLNTSRLAVQFGNSMDNAAFAMTSSGWATGTEDNSGTGTDCSFQTARKGEISTNTSADTATVSAPAQGAYAFHGVVFIPPAFILGADGSASGTGTVASVSSAIAGVVGGAVGVAVALAVAASLVLGTASATGAATVFGVGASLFTAVGSSDGLASVTGFSQIIFPTVGSSAGTATVDGISAAIASVVGSSEGTATVLGSSTMLITSVFSSDGTAVVLGVGEAVQAFSRGGVSVSVHFMRAGRVR